MKKYAFFQNKECEYFPCHEGADAESFNCLFCYCPLYLLKEKCGGQFERLENGVKDCSKCRIPHKPGGYEYVMGKMDVVIEQGRIKNKIG